MGEDWKSSSTEGTLGKLGKWTTAGNPDRHADRHGWLGKLGK